MRGVAVEVAVGVGLKRGLSSFPVFSKRGGGKKRGGRALRKTGTTIMRNNLYLRNKRESSQRRRSERPSLIEEKGRRQPVLQLTRYHRVLAEATPRSLLVSIFAA